MPEVLYSNEYIVNSRGAYSARYYCFKVEVILNSQNKSNKTSNITTNIYLGTATTSTSARWTGSYYYIGQYANPNDSEEIELDYARHANYSGPGITYANGGFVLMETDARDYQHDANGELTIDFRWLGKRTSGTSQYVPVDFSASYTIQLPSIKGNTIFVKTDEGWKEGNVYVKTAEGWQEADAVFVKTAEGWQQAG